MSVGKEKRQRGQGEQHREQRLQGFSLVIIARGEGRSRQRAERLAMDAHSAPAEHRRAGEKACA